MSTYQLFANKDDVFEVRKPTIKAAREYAQLLIRCATRSMTERSELASQFGWAPSSVKDEIFYESYQRERASVLFPALREEIAQNLDCLNVSEVDKAEAFFTKATGLALSGPSVSLSELGTFLSDLATASKTADINQPDTTETYSVQ